MATTDTTATIATIATTAIATTALMSGVHPKMLAEVHGNKSYVLFKLNND